MGRSFSVGVGCWRIRSCQKLVGKHTWHALFQLRMKKLRRSRLMTTFEVPGMAPVKGVHGPFLPCAGSDGAVAMKVKWQQRPGRAYEVLDGFCDSPLSDSPVLPFFLQSNGGRQQGHAKGLSAVRVGGRSSTAARHLFYFRACL